MIFRVVSDGAYRLTEPELGIELLADRLRRERNGDLLGELTAACGLQGARVIDDGVLSIGAFNFSSPRARQERARQLAERARTNGKFDWLGMLEELCQRVLQAERMGTPAVLLHTIPRPAPEPDFDVLGLRFPKHHPTIFFGDGGTLKSYLALFCAMHLSQGGVRVGYFDWELEASAHRERLEQLAGSDMPAIPYVRCERPLVYEVDRLSRIIGDAGVQFAIFDSAAFATDGPPESAEAASAYFRAHRRLRIGSIHIAHVTKGENADQRPFGSVFWHNGARAAWNVKVANTSADGRTISLGLFNRKANLGPLRTALGFEVTFTDSQTTFRRIDIADVEELASGLPLWQRMRQAVKHRPQTIAELATELDAKPDSVDRMVRRHKHLFTRVPGGDGIHRIALVEKRAS